MGHLQQQCMNREDFLQENTRLNDDELIPFIRTGWADEITRLGKFDLILGSDLLYEEEHAALLSGFIDQHAKPHCEVIIVDPGRSQYSRFSKLMTELGYTLNKSKPKHTAYLEQPFKGQIFRFDR